MPEPNPDMRDGMIALFEMRMRDLGDDLATGRIDLGTFQAEMRQEMRDLYALQVVAASGGDRASVNPNDWLQLGPKLKGQYEYLADFSQEIADGKLTSAQIAARAAQYTRASKAAYWNEVNKDYDVPAQPGDGTVCHCGCSWRFVVNDDGSVDGFWEKPLGNSCDICIWRSENWYPIRVREAVAEAA